MKLNEMLSSILLKMVYMCKKYLFFLLMLRKKSILLRKNQFQSLKNFDVNNNVIAIIYPVTYLSNLYFLLFLYNF